MQTIDNRMAMCGRTNRASLQEVDSDIDVSVIVPVYNASALVGRCLDSVFGQEGSCSIEVILVDDGSTDNSVEIINARPEQDRIRLFRQANSGPSAARNRGIAEARGRYIAFIDADDYWLPGFLNVTTHFLKKHAECVAVSVAQRHLSTSGEHESPKDWRELAPNEGTVLNDFFNFWALHNHICTGSILIRSEVTKATGGMREDLRVCEDLEYWAFLATFGKMGYIPQLLFVSDGSKVTADIGWVAKHLPRWNAAVAIEDWQRRIVERNPMVLKDKGFITARGRIARNLTYSILMSKRYALARVQIREYGSTFPKDNMSRLLRVGASNPLLWLIVSRALVYREYHRK